MADSVIGALRVVLGLDTAAFSSGAKDAESVMDRFANSFNSFAKQTTTIAAGIGLEKFAERAIEGFGDLIKSSIETADQIGKMSEKIGIPVAQLSQLTVAATLSDVGLDQLAKGVAALDKEMVAAAAGGTDKAASAFMFLGISVKQLQTLKPDEVLGKIADGLSKLNDGATKTAVASALFGQRIGKDLIPLLNEGSKGLEEMAHMAEALGLVISENTSKNAKTFVDNTKLMGLAVQGVANTVAAYFLPSMADASKAMVKWISDGGYVATTAEVIVRAITFLTDNIKVLGVVLGVVFGGTIIRAVGSLGLAFLELGKAMIAAGLASTVLVTRLALVAATGAIVVAAVAAMTGQLGKLEKILTDIAGGLNLQDVGKEFTAILGKMGLDTKAFTENLNLGKQNADDLNKSLKDLMNRKFDPNMAADAKKLNDEILKLSLRAKETNGDFHELATGFVQAAIQAKLLKDTGEGFKGTLDSLTPAQLKLNNALKEFNAAKMTQEFLDPWEKYEKTLQQINADLGDGAKNSVTFQRASAKAASDMATQYTSAAANTAGAFADMFTALGGQNAKYFEVAKAFSIAQAIINVLEGVTKAYAQGGVLGFITGAGVLATGMATVAKIIATQPPKAAAMGGQFAVKGAGGTDTQMVPIMMTPGERVSVDPNKYGEGMGTARTITLRGLSPKQYYRGDVLRDFVDNLNQAISDGLKIKLA